MATRDEIIEKIIARINERVGRARACVVCGKTEWTVEPTPVNLSLSRGPGLVIGGPQLPNVVLVCTHCGNTHLLNLVVLGLKADELRFDDAAK